MKEEDEVWSYIRDCARIETTKAIKETVNKSLEEKDKRIAELERQLKEQSK